MRSGNCRTALLGALAVPFALLIGTDPAHARITRIEITSVESPTFEGRTFGRVGAYEKLRGTAYGEVDPDDPLNAVITDIHNAPTDNGKVEYSMDIYILKPIDLSRGNRRVFIDVNNRGNKRFGGLNNSPNTNDPTTADDAGEGFFMNRGYAIVSNGWDPGAPSGNNRLTITVPVATDDGATITGPSYEYINFDNATSTSYGLAFPAANMDTSQATLTMKAHLNDPPAILSDSDWDYIDENTIELAGGAPFLQSHIYELTYTAKNPPVEGLGLAATRNFISFLRYETEDDVGNPNPLAGYADHTYSFTVSQPGRYLNDFRTLGFNEDEQGRIVIDGMLNYIGAGTGDAINYRFGQTGRTERNRQNHFYPEGVFPFTYEHLYDPVSGREGGRNDKCHESDTCAKSIEVNSANEYWNKTGSLNHTDTEGVDLPDPPNVRFFLISGGRHGVGNGNSRGVCQQFDNPTDAYTAMRALFIDLDEWVSDGTPPPDSRVPRESEGTGVMVHRDPATVTGYVDQAELGFPAIPGVTFTGVATIRYLYDFGPNFYSDGIMDISPPDFSTAPSYPSFVSKVDADGNEIAGIRLPPVAAPVATTTGWALRRANFSENDGCEAAGQMIPFATTKAERVASGDPRLSLEERYKTHGGYVAAVAQAAHQLVRDRLMLDEDAQKYIDAAAHSDVLK